MRNARALLLYSFVISAPAFAQQHKNSMDKLAAQLQHYTDSTIRTNTYLSTSKGVYEAGEDLWFKAYSLDAQQHTLSPSDKTLYVQLIKKENDSIAGKEKYPIHNGITSGYVYLDASLPAGDYTLIAYSAHTSFHASRSIRIVKDITAAVKNNAPIQQAAAGKLQLALLPEGGYLVAGLMNHVAFKAVDDKGLPAQVSGILLEDGKQIQELKSVHAGMGSFLFKPQSRKKYQVQLADQLYEMPAIKDNGVVMQLIDNSGDSLSFKILQHPATKKTVFLRLQIRGIVQMIASGMLSDSLQINLSTLNLTNGIAEVTLFDEQLRPLAERLVYINLQRQLYITTSMSKTSYAPREKVVVKIKTMNKAGTPVPAEIGASVYDKLYQNHDDAKDILTHYYLSSQLKGRIYDPGYYFNADNKNREQALDLLLLTQGWRCYQWNETSLASEKQYNIPDNLEGKMIAVKKKKNTPVQQLLMLFNADKTESKMIPLDSARQFSLAPEDFVSGRWAYLKHFGEEEDVYRIDVRDPFLLMTDSSYPIAALKTEDKMPVSMFARGHINLKEVEITKKKAPVFRDKYLGSLDSLAKLEGNQDYAHGGWLNCPACRTGEKPVEGKKYLVYTGKNVPASHPFPFNNEVVKEIIYHYPVFTEEELLKKFHLTKVKGYYEEKTFYNPVNDQQDVLLPDYRNTLLWVPSTITDINGEATIEFICSDINSGFSGVIEGISGDGLLGKTTFQLQVVK